jgi:molybdopterin-guanine dinucleotide biosynthesis protein A
MGILPIRNPSKALPTAIDAARASALGNAGVLGVLLAGGRARRLAGGDKCLRRLGSRTLLERVVERARPQVRQLLLNANGDPARFSAYQLPVVRDVIGGFAGPVAGILTALEWARSNAPECPWVASFATDSPFFPEDLVLRLRAAAQAAGVEAACAASAGRLHPVFALWSVRLAPALREKMERSGLRKAEHWAECCRAAIVDFPGDPPDPFFNINWPADLVEAERLLGCTGPA